MTEKKHRQVGRITVVSPNTGEWQHCRQFSYTGLVGKDTDLCGFLKDRAQRTQGLGEKNKLEAIRQEICLTQSFCPAFQESNGSRSKLPCSQILFSLKERLGQK